MKMKEVWPYMVKIAFFGAALMLLGILSSLIKGCKDDARSAKTVERKKPNEPEFYVLETTWAKPPNKQRAYPAVKTVDNDRQVSFRVQFVYTKYHELGPARWQTNKGDLGSVTIYKDGAKDKESGTGTWSQEYPSSSFGNIRVIDNSNGELSVQFLKAGEVIREATFKKI